MKMTQRVGLQFILGVFLITNSTAAIYTNAVNGDFRKKVGEVSAALRIDPDYLVAVMALETAQPSGPEKGKPTFDPSIENPSSGAVGLIQFMPRVAAQMGTSAEKLKKMSAVEQMKYVQEHLAPYKGRMTRLVDVYLAVFYPAAIGKGDDYVLPQRVYAQNAGLDVNGDKKLTVGEIATKIQHYYDRGR